MGMQAESLTLINRDNTAAGTIVLGADVTGVVAYAPTRFKQDSSVIHQNVVRCIDLISTAVDRPIFAPVSGAWVLAGVEYVNRVVGSDGSAVTADVMACASAVAPVSGTTQLTAVDSINLKATADTPTAVALATTLTEVAPGAYFGLNLTGTLTAVVSMITCEFKRVR